MNFRQRILLDRLLAVPLSIVCNACVRGLGLICGRNHRIDPASTREIVVSKFVGMGSIIQATPLLRALKQQFPKAHLTFVTLEANRGLVERLEGVDDVLSLNDSGVGPMLWTTTQALGQLMRRRVDHYFDLEIYSGFACLFAVFSLARNRLGFYRHSNRFKKGIYTHLVYFNTRMPVRRLYLQLGRTAGVPVSADDRLGIIRVDPADRQRMLDKLAKLGLKPGSPYILVNPNASDLLIERRWPDGHMIQAVTALAEAGHAVVLMGAKSEAAYVRSLHERIAAPARDRVWNSAGLFSLPEAFALIEQAACVLTNDTGPMHMAFALGRPTVCLFGPVDPAHYGIAGPNIVTFYAPVPCSPCVHEIDKPPCDGNNVCMQRLLPGPVVQQVLALISGQSPDRQTRLPLVWETADGQPLGIVIRSWTNYQ